MTSSVRVVGVRNCRERSGRLAWAQTAIGEVLRWLPPGDTSLNLPYVHRLGEGHDLPDVLDAVGRLIGRHEVLRTVFPSRDGRTEQHVLGAVDFEVAVVDAEGTPPDTVAEELAAALCARPFDLGERVPVRFGVVTAHGRAARIVLAASHMTLDGACWPLLGVDLDALLADPRLPPHTARQPLDRAAWERSPEGVRRNTASLDFWRRHVADLPADWLQTVHDGTPQSSWARISSPATALALHRLTAVTRLPPGLVAQAAVVALLGSLRGCSTVGMRAIIATRFRPEYGGMVAPFNQNALLRIDLSDEPFSRFAVRCGRAALAAYAASECDPVELERAVAEICRGRGLEPDGYCFFNDIRRGGENAAWRAPVPDDWRERVRALRGAGAARSITSRGNQKGANFFLYVERLAQTAELTLSMNPRFLPVDPAGFLNALERFLIEAALSDTDGATLSARALPRTAVRRRGAANHRAVRGREGEGVQLSTRHSRTPGGPAS